MSTFNMPPGVTTNDIPSNEPEVTLWKRVGYLQMELHGVTRRGASARC
jgi:hypothetical protein